MAVAQQGTIDFTVMYVTHDAFRRDLERFAGAVAAGKAYAAGVQAGWQNFKNQLDVHHSVEDAALWPRVISAVQGRPEALALMAEMEAEHAELHPKMDAVDAGIANRAADLGNRVADLAGVLNHHMRHEEESALPLIQEVLTPKDWGAFRGAMARRQGPKGAAMYVPWILDGLGEEDRRRFFAEMGKPVAVVNAILFQRRYDKRHLWSR
jgi:iron-sulfur cluster repair protein YtfE (RIC family)